MKNLPCVLRKRERQSVVPERYPGSNWLTGSQHQVNATLATRTVPRQRYSRPVALFHAPVAARKGHVELARGPSRQDRRVEALEFDACVRGGEAPVDAGLLNVPIVHPGSHFAD